MSAAIVALLRSGESEAAQKRTMEWLEEDPQRPEYWRAAGIVRAWRHDWDGARADFERALEWQAADAVWWRDIGVALLGAGALEQAIESLERSFELASGDAIAHTYLGETLELAGNSTKAAAAFERAVEIDEKTVAAHEGLLRVYTTLGMDRQSLASAKRLARLKRYDARSLQLLADAQFQAAQLETSLRTYRRAMRADPEAAAIYSGYLFAAVHSLRESPRSLRRLHEEWFSRYAPPSKSSMCAETSRPRHRRLRIGYVSIEFRATPTAYYLLPLMAAHDRTRFKIYGYSAARITDEVTEQYRAATDEWRTISTASAREIFEAIQRDEIDVLVDTSGQFAPKVMPVFAQRAAPVQAALPVYASTTGCSEIDYLLSDRWITPDAEHEGQYAEGAVYRLPGGCIVYAPPADAPDVNSLPADESGAITFGIFQRPAKWNDEFWGHVREILERTPRSRLLLHHGTCDFDIERVPLPPGKIEFAGRQDVHAHMRTVGRADIALDTYPYSGHTTTGDALWMGVPVVTRAEGRHASRVSASLLARAGMEDWIARSGEEFVELAVAKAGDRAELMRVRAGLRQRMREATICRADLVARELEQAYVWMHERTIARKPVPAAAMVTGD